MDYNLNRLLTSVTICSRMIYVLHCSSHSGVSVHYATYCEFRPREEVPRILKITSTLPSVPTIVFPSKHFLLHKAAYSPDSKESALGSCQLTKAQMY
jgi:hypothetical protein